MHHITFISTVHTENGNCNAEELYKIITTICPEVIFLEALESTYSVYQKNNFASYGVFHSKLEIQAIQKFSHDKPFKYVPILDTGLSDVFERKFNQLSKHTHLQRLLKKFDDLAAKEGFKFLNSFEAMELQDEMRNLEVIFLSGNEVQKKFEREIDLYENSMIQNVYSFCREQLFDKAVFLCGVAHRRSLVKKISEYERGAGLTLCWEYFCN